MAANLVKAMAKKEPAARDMLAADYDGVTAGTSAISELQTGIEQGLFKEGRVVTATATKAAAAAATVKSLLSCAESAASVTTTTLTLAQATGSNAAIKAAKESKQQEWQ